jgi:excisionase family DNA binding protein
MMRSKPQSKGQALYNVEQAAMFLGGISPHTIRKKIQRGEIRVIHLGRRTMIAQAEVDRISRHGWSALSQSEAQE